MPEERARRIGRPLLSGPEIAGPVVQLFDDKLVQRQSPEPVLELPELRPAPVTKQLGEMDELEDCIRPADAKTFLDLQEPDDVSDSLLEAGIDPDFLVRFPIETVERKSKLVEPGFDQLIGFLLVEQRAVGMEPGDDAGVMRVADHLEEIGMKEGLSSMEEMHVKDEIAGFVDDLLEQVELHESFLAFLQVLVRAHDTAEVAEARRLDPEPDGQIVQPDLFSFIAEKNPEEAGIVTLLSHQDIYFSGKSRRCP